MTSIVKFGSGLKNESNLQLNEALITCHVTELNTFLILLFVGICHCALNSIVCTDARNPEVSEKCE